MAISRSPLRAYLPLLGLLALNLLCALFVVRHTLFQAPNIEHLDAANAFVRDHSIRSSFLPIGYSALLGLANLLGGQPGMTALSILWQLLVIAAAWAYARHCGLSVRAATTLAALLSLYPDFLLSYHKAWDTAITALLLFCFLTLLLRVLDRPAFSGDDVFLGLTLGYAALVRPNLALLLPLAAVLLWRFRLPRLLPRLIAYCALALALFVTVTTLVHGHPFLPHNGPYNLFAGSNPHTQNFPLNMEDSIAPALQLEAPQVDRRDLASPALEPVYARLSLAFIRQHPVAWLRLIAFKLRILLAPDFKIHAALSSSGLLKILAACALPLWLVISCVPPGTMTSAAGRQRRLIVAALIFAYLLPFALTISSPRFRVPLDFVLWIDCGILLVQRRLGTPGPLRARIR